MLAILAYPLHFNLLQMHTHFPISVKIDTRNSRTFLCNYGCAVSDFWAFVIISGAIIMSVG